MDAATLAQMEAAGFDPNKGRNLYVGNLNPRVNEALLWEIFNTVGRVETLKIIRDKHSNESMGYGFVDYFTHEDADRALTQLNGVEVYGSAIKVNWAMAGGSREETGSHYHVFIGDLSLDVTDQMLREAFKGFGSVSEARIMFDKETGKSRGYGFVSFRVKEDAERSIREMNGAWLGSKAIRCNWANAKPAVATGAAPKRLDYDSVQSQSSQYNTTVYVGNLAPEITQDVLRNEFAPHGPITEIRTTDKGYAFVVYQSHEAAARAITALHGGMILGRQVRCSWGKDPSSGAKAAAPAPAPMPAYYPPPGYPSPYPAYYPPPGAPAYPYPPPGAAQGYYGYAPPQQPAYPPQQAAYPYATAPPGSVPGRQ